MQHIVIFGCRGHTNRLAILHWCMEGYAVRGCCFRVAVKRRCISEICIVDLVIDGVRLASECAALAYLGLGAPQE